MGRHINVEVGAVDVIGAGVRAGTLFVAAVVQTAGRCGLDWRLHAVICGYMRLHAGAGLVGGEATLVVM